MALLFCAGHGRRADSQRRPSRDKLSRGQQHRGGCFVGDQGGSAEKPSASVRFLLSLIHSCCRVDTCSLTPLLLLLLPLTKLNRPPRGLPARRPVLGPANKGKKCLVLDLDETLVHSSFQKVSGAHMTIPVTIEDTVHNVFVIKRPGVDEFMRRMGQHFEIVIYTASLSKYADPLLDKLDIHKVINKRLFRENCVFYEGHYVKDLSLLERDITQTIIVDNSPPSYTFHPENAIDCSSFIDDPADVEMWQIGDFLEGIKDCEDVRKFCRYVLTQAETLTQAYPSSSLSRLACSHLSALSLSLFARRSWKEWVSRNPTSVPLSMQTDATVTSTSPSPMAPVTLSS